jgi:hypothetical protein
MKAFHNDVAVKRKYLKRVRAHQKADELIHGIGWNESTGKGCAVGCTLDEYNHAKYETELGIPEWLAYVEDTLFEGMNKKKSETWPEEFLKAITVGAKLDKIKGPFMIVVLERALTKFDHDKFPDVKAAINQTIACWKNERSTPEDFGAALAVAGAAADAAWATGFTLGGWAAARAADAARARPILVAAADAALALAEAAAAGAKTGAAKAAEYDYFADELLRLLKATCGGGV